jgi:hypothetical protein
LCPIDNASLSLLLQATAAQTETENSATYCSKSSVIHLKTETESSFSDVVLQMRDGTVDNIQKCVSYIDIPLSETYRSNYPVGLVAET